MSASSRYTREHYQDFAALLAAEREQNGPSPALNRILAAITTLFAENNANFNRELFGKAARGTVSPTARSSGPHTHQYASQRLTHEHDGDAPHGYYEHPEDRGWTPPVITRTGDPS